MRRGLTRNRVRRGEVRRVEECRMELHATELGNGKWVAWGLAVGEYV